MNEFSWAIRPLCVLSVFVVTASTLAQSPPQPPQKTPTDYIGNRAQSLQPDRVVIYKTIQGRALELRVFLPEGWKATDRRPCFHIIHGGGWQGMDPSRMYPFAYDFAKRYGVVGISVQYRLYTPDKSVTVFDCVKDARSSVRYVRSHAEEFGIDPDKIIVAGGSAGGHLAASTALFTEINETSDDLSISCLPNALVLLFPVIDTSSDGYGQAKIGENWKDISPVDHVRSGLPPTITFHGTGDTTTPYAGALRFHEEMLAAGNQSELITHEGGLHGYLMRTEALYEACISETARFLGSFGFIKP